MGACEFTTIGVGKNADEAFRSAVERAQYDRGHAGYTGTIAEKPGFVLIGEVPEPKSAYDEAVRLIRIDDERVSDKWGPAGCIEILGYSDGEKEVAGRRFLFFGWASS